MDHLEELTRVCPAGSRFEPELAFQAVHDVLDHIQPGKQAVLLEHHEPIVMRPFHGPAVQRDFPLGDVFKSGDDVEQCRFPTAGRAKENHKFTFPDLDIDRLQRLHSLRPVRIGLRDAGQFQFDRGRRMRRRWRIGFGIVHDL